MKIYIANFKSKPMDITNNFAKAHTRYEMYQSRKQLAAAVRAARA